MSKKLKIAILSKSNKIPNWSYEMLKQLVLTQEIEISMLITSPIVPKRKNIIFHIYKKYERKVFFLSPDAMKLKDVLTPKIQEINICENNKEICAKKIKAYDIDVILKLDPQIQNNELEQVTKFGIWTIYHGTITKEKKSTPCAIEMLTNKDIIDINLICEKKSTPKKIILSNSTISVDKMSIRRTSNNAFWLSSMLTLRELKKVMIEGENYLNNKEKIIDPLLFEKSSDFLTTAQVLQSIFKKYLKKLYYIIFNLFNLNQWVLYYSFNTKNISPQDFDFSSAIPLMPPKDRFWADPFLYKKNNVYYIFFEELIYNKKKGHLSVLKINADGSYTKPEIILERPYHLSYPFVFEDNNTVYMIPETSENKTIELYKSTEFPNKWKLEKVLKKDIDAVDSTLYKKNGVYWLFANVSERKGYSKNNELFLFFSDSLLSNNWVSHPKNPIVSDVTKSRPAGKIYEINNKIYRPSQNCGKYYGYGIVINEILKLTKTDYLENKIKNINPDWDEKVSCTHSINKENDLTVIDALYLRRKI